MFSIQKPWWHVGDEFNNRGCVYSWITLLFMNFQRIPFILSINDWLVVWNIFLFFHILVISSSQLTHTFQRGEYTTNQNSDRFYSYDCLMLFTYIMSTCFANPFNLTQRLCFRRRCFDSFETMVASSHKLAGEDDRRPRQLGSVGWR